jgi:hypothetical protein
MFESKAFEVLEIKVFAFVNTMRCDVLSIGRSKRLSK